jgi:HK97 family phage major capsid protein
MITEMDDQEQRATQKKTILATYGVKSKQDKDPETRQEETNEFEQRANDFVKTNKVEFSVDEVRAVTIGSGNLISPKPVQNTINEKFNEVSSVVELVNVVSAEGMTEYEVPYVVSYAEGGIIGEGADYTEGEPVFDYATIKPIKISIYTEVTEEVSKLTPVAYLSKIRQAALIALRKKVARLIPLGNPAATPAEFTGILHADAITDSPLEFSAIDEKTLRKIAMSYGGDENIIGNAVLLINKNDLIAFGDVRGADKKSVYEITPDAGNPNAGVLSDGGLAVRYVINSALKALSDAATVATTPCMIYGIPGSYELALFSPYEIKVSEDAAFKKGMLAIKGSVFVGGNVVNSNGFLIIEKKAA